MQMRSGRLLRSRADFLAQEYRICFARLGRPHCGPGICRHRRPARAQRGEAAATKLSQLLATGASRKKRLWAWPALCPSIWSRRRNRDGPWRVPRVGGPRRDGPVFSYNLRHADPAGKRRKDLGNRRACLWSPAWRRAVALSATPRAWRWRRAVIDGVPFYGANGNSCLPGFLFPLDRPRPPVSILSRHLLQRGIRWRILAILTVDR